MAIAATLIELRLALRQTVAHGDGLFQKCAMGKITHGENKRGLRTKEYNIWCNMRKRCIGSDNRSARYKGRGITICERWADYSIFLEDMGRCPDDCSSIDRINNDGNYEPSNCRWASCKTQSSNTSRNHRLEFSGRLQTITQWSLENGISQSLIGHRLKMGWPVERTLTEKPRTHQRQ